MQTFIHIPLSVSTNNNKAKSNPKAAIRAAPHVLEVVPEQGGGKGRYYVGDGGEVGRWGGGGCLGW